MAENSRERVEDMLRDLATSDTEMTITLHSNEVVETRTFSGDPDKVLKEIPPDIRSGLRRAFPWGPKVKKSEKRIVRTTTYKGEKIIHCRCGYLGRPDDGRCPKCGRRV